MHRSIWTMELKATAPPCRRVATHRICLDVARQRPRPHLRPSSRRVFESPNGPRKMPQAQAGSGSVARLRWLEGGSGILGAGRIIHGRRFNESGDVFRPSEQANCLLFPAWWLLQPQPATCLLRTTGVQDRPIRSLLALALELPPCRIHTLRTVQRAGKSFPVVDRVAAPSHR
jgi:hypothetical protein